MCSVGGASSAELDCSVLEEDWQSGQSYVAQWHSLTLVPHDRHRVSAMEAEQSEKHWQARRLLQRFLSGAISKNEPHPKAHSARRPHQPTSNPSAVGRKVQRGPLHIQKEVCSVTEVRPKTAGSETTERMTVMKITKLPRFLG